MKTRYACIAVVLYGALLASTAKAGASMQVVATRVAHGPVFDGRLDDAVWSEGQMTQAFTHKFPIQGAEPTEATTLTGIYDDEFLYVGFACEQSAVPVKAHLTRRDRRVEADWVSVSIGSRHDGKSAFEFQVNAAGVLSDALRFDDTEVSNDWDDNWDARVARTTSGWSAEIKIPFRILRYDDSTEQIWDFQARRYTSLRQETDEWAYIPRDAAGEVSRYGVLSGLIELKRPSVFEFRPFAVGKVIREDGSEVTSGRGFHLAGSAGFDFKWHPSQALTVDGAVLPDFSQVDPDQLVLNLSQFETYYPEKRPFFLEGLDIFDTPMQLIYTRRIGRAPTSVTLRDELDERLVVLPGPSPIYGAAKVSGRFGRWAFGALEAVTGDNNVDVSQPLSATAARLLEPPSSYTAARARRDIGTNGDIGVSATAVVRADRPSAYPETIANADAPSADRLCPRGTLVGRDRGCFNDAFVTGLDWRFRSSDGAWLTTGQIATSILTKGPPRFVRDGTVIPPGGAGSAAVASLAKEGGQHWIGGLNGEFNSRNFDINDVGYDRRANNWRLDATLEYRDLALTGMFREVHTRFEYFDRKNLSGLDLGSGYQINVAVKTLGFWDIFTEVHYRPAYFDDREIGDGTALQHRGLVGYELELDSNRNKRVVLSVDTQSQFLPAGFKFWGQGSVLLRVLPQLDLEVLPYTIYSGGEPRYLNNGFLPGRYSVGVPAQYGNGAQPGEYRFGKLCAAGVGTTVRATYTFAPRLSVQVYAQAFFAFEHYNHFSYYQSSASGRRPAVRTAALERLDAPLGFNPDIEQGAFNLNAVLRWEFLLGSTFYAVYTHHQVPTDLDSPSRGAKLDIGTTRREPALDTFLLKVACWFG